MAESDIDKMTGIKTEIKIEITDYYVMLNLHKALLEAKFHQNPDNPEVAFSPIVADFCNELVDNLAKADEEKDAKKAASWNNWRKLANQPYYRERALNHALLNNRWSKMGDEEKRKMAINLLSPFQATEEEIECFIQEVNEKYFQQHSNS